MAGKARRDAKRIHLQLRKTGSGQPAAAWCWGRPGGQSNRWVTETHRVAGTAGLGSGTGLAWRRVASRRTGPPAAAAGFVRVCARACGGRFCAARRDGRFVTCRAFAWPGVAVGFRPLRDLLAVLAASFSYRFRTDKMGRAVGQRTLCRLLASCKLRGYGARYDGMQRSMQSDTGQHGCECRSILAAYYYSQQW